MYKINQKIAELAGIFAADGSLQQNYLCCWGNISEDRDYYDDILRPLFWEAFNAEIRPHEKKSNSVYGFYLCNKNILKFFNSYLGFPIGNKTYSVRIPKPIMNSKNRKIWASFIRGFFNGDGCLNFDKRYGPSYKKILTIIHSYPRIQINSVSHDIIADISILLKRLNIPHFTYKVISKKENEKDHSVLRVLGRNRLGLWIKLIGFNNPVHLTKYEIFKRYGFVPVYTSLKERKEILQGKIDPWDFYPLRARSSAWKAILDEGLGK